MGHSKSFFPRKRTNGILGLLLFPQELDLDDSKLFKWWWLDILQTANQVRGDIGKLKIVTRRTPGTSDAPRIRKRGKQYSFQAAGNNPGIHEGVRVTEYVQKSLRATWTRVKECRKPVHYKQLMTGCASDGESPCPQGDREIGFAVHRIQWRHGDGSNYWGPLCLPRANASHGYKMVLHVCALRNSSTLLLFIYRPYAEAEFSPGLSINRYVGEVSFRQTLLIKLPQMK